MSEYLQGRETHRGGGESEGSPDMYKPHGPTSVSPYIIVDGASRTIDLLGRGVDAVELHQFPASDGKPLHAEVRIDDTVSCWHTDQGAGPRCLAPCWNL